MINTDQGSYIHRECVQGCVFGSAFYTFYCYNNYSCLRKYTDLVHIQRETMHNVM